MDLRRLYTFLAREVKGLPRRSTRVAPTLGIERPHSGVDLGKAHDRIRCTAATLPPGRHVAAPGFCVAISASARNNANLYVATVRSRFKNPSIWSVARAVLPAPSSKSCENQRVPARCSEFSVSQRPINRKLRRFSRGCSSSGSYSRNSRPLPSRSPGPTSVRALGSDISSRRCAFSKARSAITASNSAASGGCVSTVLHRIPSKTRRPALCLNWFQREAPPRRLPSACHAFLPYIAWPAKSSKPASVSKGNNVLRQNMEFSVHRVDPGRQHREAVRQGGSDRRW